LFLLGETRKNRIMAYFKSFVKQKGLLLEGDVFFVPQMF